MRTSQSCTRRRALALLSLLAGGGTVAACTQGQRSWPASPALLTPAPPLTTRPVTAPAAPPATPAPGITIRDAWARAAAAGDGTATSAAYLTLLNQEDVADVLVAARCPVAAAVDLHRSAMEDGVMRMRPAGDVPVPARGTVTMQPGGLHVMLMGLRQDLVDGASIPLTLELQRGGIITVNVPVRSVMS